MRLPVTLRLEAQSQLAIAIQDDGAGFDIGQVKTGLGLRAIAGRVDQFGGTLDLTSSVGAGTRLSILLPLAAQP